MALRKISKTKKDSDGDIIALCNPGEPWSPVSKDQAIREIDGGMHEYYTDILGQRAKIIVVKDHNGKKFLRTDKDSSTSNNLGELPNC